MPKYVAFLRAVNVGGRVMKMEVLRQTLQDTGLSDVRTHIQSGNVLFASPARSAARLEARIEAVIRDGFGYEADTMVRSGNDLAALVRAGDELADPYGGGARHMVSVLKSQPAPDAQQGLDDWPEPGVRGVLVGRQLHLFYDMTMTDSTLTGPRLAKIVGCAGTVREWRVVQKLDVLLNG